MKLNPITTIIATAISAIIAYCLYSWCKSDNQLLIGIGGFVFIATTLIFTISVSFEQPRTTTNIRVLSGVFFVLALISSLIFMLVQFNPPLYILINGIIFLIWLLIVYALKRANM